MSTFRVSRQTYDINSLLEKAFSDGYEYALEEREFGIVSKFFRGLSNRYGKKAFKAEEKELGKLAKERAKIDKRVGEINEIHGKTPAGGATAKGEQAAEEAEGKSGWGKKALIGGGIAAAGGGLYLANKKNK